MHHQMQFAGRRTPIASGRPIRAAWAQMRCRQPRVVAQRVASVAQQGWAAATATTDQTGPVWSSHLSRRINLDLALEEAIEGIRKGQPDSWEPELAVVFASSAYVRVYHTLVSLLRAKVPSLKFITGSTGYGVIGSTAEGPMEIEHAPALSLTLASLPGTNITITHVAGELPDGDAPPDAWAQLLGVQLHSSQPTNFILLAEPEFAKLQELTDGLDFAFPAANKIGGLISAGKLSQSRAMFAWSSEQSYEQQAQQQGRWQGAVEQQQEQQDQQQEPEQQQDFLQQQQQQQQQSSAEQQQPQAELQQQDEQQQEPQVEVQQQQPQQQQQQQKSPAELPWPAMLRTGAVVLSLQGPVELELLIAQGCRPLSESIYTIDAVADGGPVVLALRDARGRKLMPLEALQTELEKVASSRSELLVLLRNMALGLMPEVLRVTDGPPPEPHDFLIRGMALSKAGFMIVGDSVRVGQRVRFMVRDREGAQQDLTSHCLAYKRRELAAMLGGTTLATPTPSSSSSGSSASSSAGGVASSSEQQQAEGEGMQQQQQQEQQQQRRAFGMLLFSCNGRGMNLYDQPSWDSRTLAGYIPVPVSGFMCNGEIGSLGGSTHLHGFTCAAAVLRSLTPVTQQTSSSGADNSSSVASGNSNSSGTSSSAGVGSMNGRMGESSSSSSDIVGGGGSSGVGDSEGNSASEAAGTGRVEPGEDKA